MLLRPGDRVGDRLTVDRPLGEGAFAEVHRVTHDYLGLQAMKLFKRVASEEETAAMLGEAQLLSTLGHPNIIRVFDANTVRTPEGVRGFFTMEYVNGGNLETLAAGHRKRVPTGLVTEVLRQIAAGLELAHAQDPPIVHRDLTLANVLIGRDDQDRMRVLVSDFGLAKRADPVTRLASAQGTYAFMAPEVVREDGYSCASDVWSVGTIAYWLLTNRFPFDDGGPFSSYSLARFRRRLLPPRRYNDDVGAELDRIVLAALELDPRNRLRGAAELAAALRDVRRPLAPRALDLVARAEELSRTPGRLGRAADLLEDAIALEPRLREDHAYRLSLWRRGVVM